MPSKAHSTLATREDHERLFQDAIRLLRSARTTLSDLLDQALMGEPGSLRDVRPADLESALRRAFEAEARWNDWLAREGGEAPEGEIDLDAVRRDLACRLERLRECCQDG